MSGTSEDSKVIAAHATATAQVADNVRDLAALREHRAALERRLGTDTGVEARHLLKAEIIALHRDIDRALEEHTALRESTRALAVQWKEAGASLAGPASGPPRVDHLGASTYIEKGWSFISLDEPVQAEHALRRACELAPENPEAESLLAWALALQHRDDDASSVLDGTLGRAPTFPLALSVAGLVALQRGRHDDAIEHLTNAIAHSRSDRRAMLYAHLHLGMLYFDRDMHVDAEHYLRRAIELGPNLVQASLELGRTLWFDGRNDEAIATWRRASAENKFSVWAKRCAGMLELIERGDEPTRSR